MTSYSGACRIVLFDAVGTLIWPDPPVFQVYADAAAKIGCEIDASEVSVRIRQVWEAESSHYPSLSREPTSEEYERSRWYRIVRRVFPDINSRFEEMFESLWRHFAQPRNWRLFDDVIPALEICRAHGIPFGIASNFDGRFLEIYRGIDPLSICQQVFVSSIVGYSKPDPQFFAAVEKALNIDRTQIMLVGDDLLNDIAGGRSAGWRVTHIDRSRKLQQQGKSHVEDCLYSLKELHRVL